MLNRIQIIGNLGADPELRYTPSGKAVTNLRVAVNHSHQDGNGEWQKETIWFGVEVWDKAAERIARQARKGHKIYAEGRLRMHEWTDRDGKTRTTPEIRSTMVIDLEKQDRDDDGDAPSGGQPAGASSAPAAAATPMVSGDDEMPF